MVPGDFHGNGVPSKPQNCNGESTKRKQKGIIYTFSFWFILIKVYTINLFSSIWFNLSKFIV